MNVPNPSDAEQGMAWFNGLTEIERMLWLDIAWRRNEKAAGRRGYSTEDLPSAADAWEAYKAQEHPADWCERRGVTLD